MRTKPESSRSIFFLPHFLIANLPGPEPLSNSVPPSIILYLRWSPSCSCLGTGAGLKVGHGFPGVPWDTTHQELPPVTRQCKTPKVAVTQPSLSQAARKFFICSHFFPGRISYG